MNEKVALFFDIDGTLFNGKTRSILPSTLKMLEELKKHDNYDLYLSTGRSRQTLGTLNHYKQYFRGLNLSNGQEVYIDGVLYSEDFIKKDLIKKLLEVVELKNIPIALITTKDVEMNFFTKESYDNFTNYVKTEVINLDHAPFDLSKDVMQMWAFATNEQIDELCKEFPDLTFLKWGIYGADIIPNGASKASGIKLIQKIEKYETKNMYAFGDGDNDALMFEVVGTSVAMGNGSELAKRKASFITDNIENDGLYNALKKLNLI